MLQAHFGRLPLPIADYGTDTKSVLDQCVRVLQSMIDMAADQGWLATALQLMTIVQMLVQARWHTDPSLLTLPHFSSTTVSALEARANIGSLPEMAEAARTERGKRQLKDVLRRSMSNGHADDAITAVCRLPLIDVTFRVGGNPKTLLADEEYALDVTLNRISGSSGGGTVRMARLGKPVNEAWWLVLGERETGELLALKRLGGLRGRSMSTSLAFFTAEDPGDATYTLYLVSDCYLGLDQQYDFQVSTVSNDTATNSLSVDSDGYGPDADLYD